MPFPTAVAVPTSLIGPGGWDLWPLVVGVFVLMIARRMRRPIGAPVLLLAGACVLLTPAVVSLVGRVGLLTLGAVAWATSARRRPGDAPRSGPAV
jgi:hypothetical protein